MSTSSATTESPGRVEQADRPETPLPANRSQPAETSPDETSTPEDVETHLWLSRTDQLFVGVLSIAALALMAWHWAFLSGWGMRPVEIEHLPVQKFDYRLEINSATQFEWMQLDGIGETLAERIIQDRRENGPFQSIDDLARVKGIGAKTVDRLRPWVKLAPKPQ